MKVLVKKKKILKIVNQETSPTKKLRRIHTFLVCILILVSGFLPFPSKTPDEFCNRLHLLFLENKGGNFTIGVDVETIAIVEKLSAAKYIT